MTIGIPFALGSLLLKQQMTDLCLFLPEASKTQLGYGLPFAALAFFAPKKSAPG